MASSTTPHTTEFLAYVAGIVDGEGHVAFNIHERHRPLRFGIEVQMTDEPLIRLLHQAFGGGFYFQKRRKPHHKDLWRWRVTGEPAKAVYRLIHPYLRIKLVDVDQPVQRPDS